MVNITKTRSKNIIEAIFILQSCWWALAPVFAMERAFDCWADRRLDRTYFSSSFVTKKSSTR